MTKITYEKKLFDLDTWITLSKNLSARDKLVKIIQYFARILLWYYRKIDIDESSLRTLCEIKSITSLSRRSFRFFRSVNHINRLSNAVTDIIENKHSSLDDLLITSVGILDDFLLILYFGYENYLFFVSSKILKIKNETESALRNSSSIVSFIGSFTRILGVCLRIHRSTHVSERRKKRLACFIEMNSSYENELKQLLKVREIQRLQENQLMLEHKNEFKQELDALSSQRQILPKQQLEQGKLGTLEEQQEEYKEGIRLHNEYEIQLYLKEKERLEMDYRQATNERRTLHWDATVVTMELIISANYKPFCYWQKLFNYSAINEGHEELQNHPPEEKDGPAKKSMTPKRIAMNNYRC